MNRENDSMNQYVKAVAVCLITLLIAAGCSGKKEEESEQSIAKIREKEGIPVRVVEAGVKKLDKKVQLSGTVEAPDEVHLTPEVGGEVVAIYKDKGDSVRKGEPLVQIKKTDYELGYKQAKAAYEAAVQQLTMAKTGARSEELQQAKNMLDQAQAQYDMVKKSYNRVKELYDQGVASKQDLDRIEAQLIASEKQFDSAKETLSMAKTGARPEEIKMLEAQVERAQAARDSAKLMLDRTTVRSTVDGVISYRFFKFGESIGTNHAIYQILSAGQKKISFTINERNLHEVKEGDTVDFRAPSIPGKQFKAKVTYVSRFVRKMTREAELEAVVTEEPVPLAHGMFVEGEVILPDVEAFVIPYKALIENRYVLVVENDKGYVRDCHDTERTGEYVIIRDDCIKPGELVVAEGQGILEDGMKVNVLEKIDY